jgi:DNA replicative helicase MCM subunit Mcm2 (Cdc46/Mcm family)
MIGEITQNFYIDYKFNLAESSIKSKNHTSLHHELNKLIHHEFQKDFIKKLYPNPKWTNRVYWNVIGRIQDEHEEIQLGNIIKGVDQYLEDNNMCVSQRDLLKFIRESIIAHQIEGKSKIEDVSEHATDNGVTVDRFNEAIKRMKADGSIFEPTDGFYKCI